MVDQQPDNPNTSEQKQDSKSLFDLARSAEKGGQAHEALQLYDQIVDKFQDNDEAEEFVALSRSLRASLLDKIQSQTMGPMQILMAVVVGFGVWILIGLGIAAIFSVDMRIWWSEKWHLVIIVSVAVLILLGISRWLEQKLALQTESKRRAVLAFLIVPLITLGMMAVIALGASRMALALELILILVAALVPAVTYYLFIVVRRPSIFNEFLANLSGLGLLSPHPTRQKLENEEGNVYVHLGYESQEERRTRVDSYFQRFESIYGLLRFDATDDDAISRSDFVAKLLDSIDRKTPELRMPEVNVLLTDIFRANLVIPIGLVTILTTLGWLLTLQPDLTAVLGQSDTPSQTNNVSVTPSQADMTGIPGSNNQGALVGAEDETVTGGSPDSNAISISASGSNSTDTPIAELVPTWTPAGFAFLGAYFFGIQMIFRRFVRRDLGPNAFMAFANRILLAWIGIWVVMAIYILVPEGNADVVKQALTDVATGPQEASGAWPPWIYGLAFVLGVFPRVLWQFLSVFATKLLFVKLVIPTVEPKQPLVELDGLTIWHEARLEEEDVENVPNMATVNVVDILLHTQIPAERLVSWIDQAILFSVLGPEPKGDQAGRREKLRNLGVRNATQIIEAWNATVEEKTALKTALGDGAANTIIRSIQIESNYNTVKAWRECTKYD
ncbi:MAG: hypothetical protein ABFS45_13740 [Pseudomonadota bacterium]